MNKGKRFLWALLLGAFFLNVMDMNACSMYKVTVGDKTVVGCNEDAWRLTPHLWFENKSQKFLYGAAFTGSRFDGEYGYAPQSGMNEMGLAYSRLASKAMPQQKDFGKGRLKIEAPTNFLKAVLHQCKNVLEVKAYFERYDHSFFSNDVLIYVDREGNYLVVEPYLLTLGKEDRYVLSNFCPSVTAEVDRNRLDRYRHGKAVLSSRIDTTLDFCKNLSDTMHVCRNKIGDGTLLTSIWDLKNLSFSLYFYHQFKDVQQFNLRDELSKGDRLIEVKTLFSANKEFEQLGAYKIPQNSKWMMFGLIGLGGFFFISSFIFLFLYFRNRNKQPYVRLQLLMFPLGLIMLFYLFVLCTHMYIFYFDFPYVDAGNVWVSMSSYVPIVLLLLMWPMLSVNYKLIKQRLWSGFSRVLFTLNNLSYLLLLVLFVYWGLFGI